MTNYKNILVRSRINQPPINIYHNNIAAPCGAAIAFIGSVLSGGPANYMNCMAMASISAAVATLPGALANVAHEL